MSIPGRADAASLLLSLDPPAWLLRHSRAVAEIAAFLADRIADRAATAGVREAAPAGLDRRLVEAAALLHDVDKALPPDDPLRRDLPHGAASARWLEAAGHPELGPAVSGHPVVRLADGAAADAWLSGATLEELVVAYADKRAGRRLEPMADRFASWRRRYPLGESAEAWSLETVEAIRERAELLEARVCGAAGIAPAAVRRLRWTETALREARAREGRA